MFKVGDKVKRIRKSRTLLVDKIYVIEKIYNDAFSLVGFAGLWAPNYFQLVEKAMFSKKDLKTGMRVKHRNGQVGIVLFDLGYIGYSGGYNNLSHYNQEIKYIYSDDQWDIVKVFDKPDPAHILKFEYHGSLLWEEPAKETPQQKQIRELEETIKKATQQIEELKANS